VVALAGNGRSAALRRVIFAFIVLGVLDPAFASEPTFIHFTNYRAVFRVPTSGGAPEQWIPEGIHGWIPGIAIDDSRRIVYWVDNDYLAPFASIVGRSLEGGNAYSVVSMHDPSVEFFGELDLDEQAGFIYWSSERDSGSILRVDLDGSDIRTVASVAGSNIKGLVAHSTGYIFWTTHEGAPGSGAIRRARSTGGEVEEYLGGVDEPFALAVGPDSLLYWTDIVSGCIHRTDARSPTMFTVLDGLESPSGLAFDKSTGRMYWGEGNSIGRLQSATAAGTDVTNIATGHWPIAIAVAPANIAVDRARWGEVKRKFR